MPNKKLSNFLKDDLGIRQCTVFNLNNELHCENSDSFWIMKDFHENLLEDKNLYKKYEKSHGGQFHLELPDFKMNGLLDGVEMMENKTEEKFASWEIEYKYISIADC